MDGGGAESDAGNQGWLAELTAGSQLIAWHPVTLSPSSSQTDRQTDDCS